MLENNKIQELEIGDVMPDGTIYAGVSPKTKGTALFVTPTNAPLPMTWKEALEYAAGLNAHGHPDWRLPTRNELKLVYENSHKGALKGTFTGNTGSGDADCYWSCTEHFDHSSLAHVVNFTTGSNGWELKKHRRRLSACLVRTEPRADL